jgi:hypothetical protein
MSGQNTSDWKCLNAGMLGEIGLGLFSMHDWFYYTSTKCAIPDDMAGQQRF